MMRSEDSGCVVPWSVAMVLVYDSIFINYTQLMGETTHCNIIFRDRIQLYMYDCIAV